MALEMIMSTVMNFSSFLMILIFVAIGYVVHPIVLPFVENDLPKAEAPQEVAVDEVPEVDEAPVESVELATPTAIVESVESVESVEQATPVVVEDTAEPEPVVGEEEVVSELETSKQTGKADIAAVMQKSVKAGDVTEFAYDDVQAWEFLGEEDFDGSSYIAGECTVKVTTILGVSERKVKALCRNGGVVKWVWAASGVKIE